MKLVANMHKVCYEACIETKWCNHCIDCGNALRWSHALLPKYEQYSFHCLMPATLTFNICMIPQPWQFTNWIRPGVFSATKHIYSSTRFIHSHITSSDLVDNNAVSLYSQLNGLLTTLGPHSVRYILHWKAVLRLSAHLAGITQSGTI